LELTVSGVDAPTAAHLHTAPSGAVGPVTVVLTAVAGGPSTGCAAVPPELAASVAGNPRGFYVDVHDDAHPAGAVRGQLER
jgi:CHRD domain-containing protein